MLYSKLPNANRLSRSLINTIAIFIQHSQALPSDPPRSPETKTTNTAAYAALEPKISDLFALLKSPTTPANATVKPTMIPIRPLSLFTSRSATMAPMRRPTANIILMLAVAAAICLSSKYSSPLGRTLGFSESATYYCLIVILQAQKKMAREFVNLTLSHPGWLWKKDER